MTDRCVTYRARRQVVEIVAIILAATAAMPAALGSSHPPTGHQNPTQSPASTSRPSAAELVQRARAYVVGYGAALSLVIGVERYRQWVENSESDPAVRIDRVRPWTRETVSEFALVRITDDWLGYRDVFQVDGKTVNDRQDRLRQLFEE